MGWKSVGGGGAGTNPWQAFTPVWTASIVNPVIGNGILSGRYVQTGDTVHFYLSMIAGSTTTFGTGTWRLTVPVAAAAATGAFPVRCLENGVDNDTAIGILATTTYIEMVLASLGNVVGPNTPFTWGNGDKLEVSGTYEAA